MKTKNKKKGYGKEIVDNNGKAGIEISINLYY